MDAISDRKATPVVNRWRGPTERMPPQPGVCRRSQQEEAKKRKTSLRKRLLVYIKSWANECPCSDVVIEAPAEQPGVPARRPTLLAAQYPRRYRVARRDSGKWE